MPSAVFFCALRITFASCGRNGVDVHIFEVMDAGECIYCGRIEFDKPYTETQPGENVDPRKVCMFPICPVPDNDVKKLAMFVFKDMEDFKNQGKIKFFVMFICIAILLVHQI